MTGYTNFQNTKMLPEFERVPDWNKAIVVPGSNGSNGSTEGASGAAAEEVISDAAVLRRVVPELGEPEARMLLAASGGDLKAAVAAALQRSPAKL